MNSALQCLSSAAPIVDFLVSGKFQEDVNVDNPLGSKGAMAEAYAGVVTELWSSRTAVVDVSFFFFFESQTQLTTYDYVAARI